MTDVMQYLCEVYSSMWNLNFSSATARFHFAKQEAALSWPSDGIERISIDSFFNAYATFDQNRYNGPSVDGDFDDMGMSSVAGQYHYDQKVNQGRL